MFFTISLTFAQNEPETASPLMNTEIMRKVAFLDTEGKIHEDVIISFKSITPVYFIFTNNVKVKAVDKHGMPVFKKTFKKYILVCFLKWTNTGRQKNFNQIIIKKSASTGENVGIIREKEGVY